MSFQDRIDSALTLLKEHNEAIHPGDPSHPGEFYPDKGQIKPDQFVECIKAVGGTTEERLKAFSYEDILECLPAYKGIKPRLLAKEIAKIFRGKEDVLLTEADGKRPIPGKKAERMTPRELVEAFDPEEPTSPVGKRLKEMSKGQKFLVYSAARQIDVETSLKILLEVKQGFEGREDVDVNGVTKKVYGLGELPDNFAEENPLYHNRPLRPDGTCDHTGRSWEGVGLEIRQVIYLAAKKGDINVFGENGLHYANAVINAALAPDALMNIRKTYRKAAIEFDKLKETNNLPALKISLGQKEGGHKARPFEGGKRVTWHLSPSVPNQTSFFNAKWENK